MAQTEKILGQVKVASASTPESLYSPASGVTGIIVNIIVCETGGATATFSLYADATGTGTAAANTLFKNVSLSENETKVLAIKLPIASATGQVSCEASTTNVVFTATGMERS